MNNEVHSKIRGRCGSSSTEKGFCKCSIMFLSA
jgi:hypothetical protein